MTTLVLWGDDGHMDRAKGLAVAYACECRDVEKDPKSIKGLTRLSFWGHGIPAEFCGMSAEAFMDRLLKWKSKNSGLDSVEFITCNGRYMGGGERSFTDQVQVFMRLKKYASLAKIKLRGLPNATTPSGKTCHFSILSWEKTTRSWAYVATPGFFTGSSSQHETYMFEAKYFLDQLTTALNGQKRSYLLAHADMMSMSALTVRSPWAIAKKMDQKKVDEFNEKLTRLRQDAFIMAGNSVGSLAWHLKEIK